MSDSASGPHAVIRRYLDAVASQDWGTARGCLTEDVRRIGPFGDTYAGRDAYLAFLSALMPTLTGYRMLIERIIAGTDGMTVIAELTETVEMDGRPSDTPESLVFDLDSDSRIREIRIYIQQLS